MIYVYIIYSDHTKECDWNYSSAAFCRCADSALFVGSSLVKAASVATHGWIVFRSKNMEWILVTVGEGVFFLKDLCCLRGHFLSERGKFDGESLLHSWWFSRMFFLSELDKQSPKVWGQHLEQWSRNPAGQCRAAFTSYGYHIKSNTSSKKICYIHLYPWSFSHRI